MIKVLAEEYYFYTFEYDDETDEYFLDVVCGTVAIFTLKIKLSDAEIAAYKDDPRAINWLANKVLGNPHEFNARAIR